MLFKPGVVLRSDSDVSVNSEIWMSKHVFFNRRTFMGKSFVELDFGGKSQTQKLKRTVHNQNEKLRPPIVYQTQSNENVQQEIHQNGR